MLIKKKRPEWQAGHWNGIGGKIEDNELPEFAIIRECFEETGMDGAGCDHVITMLCDGGTVFVYRAFCINDDIPFTQVEDELLMEWPVDELPETIMVNCKWMIEICLANHIQYPVIVQQIGLGIE